MSYNTTWDYQPSTSPKPPPANNPFLETSAANRFPAIDSSGLSSPPVSSFATGYQQPQGSSYGPSPGLPTFQYQQYGGQSSYNTNQIPQQQQWTGIQSTYSPNGGYGGYLHQAQPQLTGFSSGYGQPQSLYPFQQQQPQFTGYPQSQQQQHPQYNAQQFQRSLVNEFDPYGNVGSLANPGQTGTSPYSTGQSQQQQQRQQQQSFTSGRTGPSGQQHPRDFVQSHKIELESWNAEAWKQILSISEELKRAWEKKRAELQRHLLAGQYLTREDTEVLNSMIKTSESNIDSVAAALLQMQEVHASYKHSIDAAGKTRVREALNAGLVNLPDWP